MSSVIGKVSAVFTSSASGLVSGVNHSTRALSGLQRSVNSVASSSRALVAIQGAQLFGSILSGATSYARSLVSVGLAQAQVIDGQRKLAGRLGFTYGELAGVAHAAGLSGVSMDSVANAATKADVALVNAQGGSKAAQAAFAGLGLDVAQLAAMSPADRFNAIAAAIANIPDAAGRSAAAVALFGRAGAQLLPMFEQGAEGIAAAQAEAERLGLTLTTAQAKDVEAMNDSFTKAQQAVSGVVGQVVSYLSPAVTAIANQFTELVGSIGGANIGQAIGEGLLAGARYFAGVGDWFIANLGGIWTYASSVWEQAGTVVDLFNRAAAFLGGVWDLAEVGMGTVILGFGKVIEGIAYVAEQIGSYLGFDVSSLSAFKDGAAAFNAEVSAGIVASSASAAENFGRAFGESGEPVAAAVAGPLTTALDQAIAQAQASAASVDTSPVSTPISSSSPTSAATEDRALKAIDSRSSEGLSEMFRIMRGRPNGAAERTAAASERIAEGIDDLIGLQENELVLGLEG